MIPTIRQLAQSLFNLTVFMAGSAPAWAQVPENFETSVRAAMAPSIAKQRLSVEKQATSVIRANMPAGARPFFVLPIAADSISVGTASRCLRKSLIRWSSMRLKEKASAAIWSTRSSKRNPAPGPAPFRLAALSD